MPKLGCKCGYIFRLGYIPCKDEYTVISDVKLDAISSTYENSKLYAGGEILDAIVFGPMKNRILLICPVCGRIYIEDSDNPSRYCSYVSEVVLHNNNVDYTHLFPIAPPESET